MTIIRKCNMRAFIIVITLAISACTQFEIRDHSEQFNNAAGDSSLNILLLNAVRASKDYPLQFSKIQSYDGIGSPSLTLQGKIPFGPAATPIYGLDPQLVLKSGVSKLSLADLNTAEAQAALKKQLTQNDYRYYRRLAGGRRLDVLETLVVETYRVTDVIFTYLRNNANRVCNEYQKKKYDESFNKKIGGRQLCVSINEFRARCLSVGNATKEHIPVKSEEIYVDLKKHQYLFYLIENNATNECDFLQFRAFSEYLDYSGMTFYAAKLVKDKDDIELVAPNTPIKSRAFTELANLFCTDRPILRQVRTRDRLPAKLESIDMQHTRSKSITVAPNLDINFNLVDKKIDSEEKKKDSMPDTYTSFCNRNILVELDKLYCKGLKNEELSCFAAVYRSPERVVRYLGDIIAAKNYPQAGFSPFLHVNQQTKFELFDVKRGNSVGSNAVLSVRDPEGDTFFVVKPEYGDDARHRTMEVLAFVTELINSAVSSKDVPQVTSFTITPQ